MSIDVDRAVARPAPASAAPAPPPGRARRALVRAFLLAVLGLFALFFVLPVVWLLLAPTRSDAAIVRGRPFALGSLHGLRETWHHLYAFGDGVILHWLANSTLYVLLAMAITLLTGIPAGYAMALLEFRGRRLLLTATLLVMLMPAATLVLPLYLEMDAIGLTGTIWSVVLPFSFFPFGVYLTYIYFSSHLPSDLLAAARVDGCSEVQVFTRVALPLARPVVALVAFFGLVQNWNNFFLPFVMLPDSSRYPAQVGLNNLLTASAVFNTAAGTDNQILRPELALATLITIVPVLVLFLVSQRALVSGMLAGATKE